MTLLGKIFVMVNLVISLMMMAVATGLYASAVDRPPKPAETPLNVQRKAELKELLSMANPVENGWRKAHGDLLTREGERGEDQTWYQTELAHVRYNAKPDDPAGPARMIVLADNGFPVPDPNPKFARRPQRVEAKDRNGGSLWSIAYSSGELKKAQEQNFAELAKLEKAFQEDTRLTNLLVPPKPAKGLRQRIVEERLKREGIDFEIEAVDRFFVKARVESAILRDRIGIMDDQINALKRTLSRMKKLDGKKGGR